MGSVGPEPAQAILAGSLDDAVDEGGAAVVGGLSELEAEEAFDEAIRLGRLDSASAQCFAEHSVAPDELTAHDVEHVVDHTDDDGHQRLKLGTKGLLLR